MFCLQTGVTEMQWFLIPLDGANRSNGAFRLSLFGGDIDNVRIPAGGNAPAGTGTGTGTRTLLFHLFK
jgi:hypothetical protein